MNSTQTVLVDLENNNTNHSDPIEVENHRFSTLKAETESETSVITTYTPPDGGMKAWRLVAGGHHFKEHLPLALGIVTAATALSLTFTAYVFLCAASYLIQAKGFAIATRIVTGICFGMLALANFLMRTQECYLKQDIQQ
ncbi:264_t:CDS:2, partial [Acaulospora colombiana]